jgi:atypical dual specificity phosphatase
MSEMPLIESLWWVIPDRLGGMRKPTPEEIHTLTEIGVNAIVSVMDAPSNLDLYEQAGSSRISSVNRTCQGRDCRL